MTTQVNFKISVFPEPEPNRDRLSDSDSTLLTYSNTFYLKQFTNFPVISGNKLNVINEKKKYFMNIDFICCELIKFWHAKVWSRSWSHLKMMRRCSDMEIFMNK
jgi:hypothetical protein